MNLTEPQPPLDEHILKSQASQDIDEVELGQESQEGKWTDSQNFKYVIFLDFHKNIFISKQKRKSIKIFKLLSDHIKTRTPRQCRSHFQKLIAKHHTICKVKTHIRNQFGKQLYDQALNHYSQNVDHEKFSIRQGLFSDKIDFDSPKETGVQTDIVYSMFLEGTNAYLQNDVVEQPKVIQQMPRIMPLMIWSPVEGVQF